MPWFSRRTMTGSVTRDDYRKVPGSWFLVPGSGSMFLVQGSHEPDTEPGTLNLEPEPDTLNQEPGTALRFRVVPIGGHPDVYGQRHAQGVGRFHHGLDQRRDLGGVAFGGL